MRTNTNPKQRPRTEEVLRLAGTLGFLRARDLVQRGIPTVYLRRLYQRDLLRQVARGVYTLSTQEPTEHHGLAEACKRVPHGVVCLLSALRYHGLGTQAPFEVWLAIDQKARSPKSKGVGIRVVRMSGQGLKSGIEEHKLESVVVKVFTPAKTVADCFKFRNKIGLDVALEALRDFRKKYRSGMDDLWRFAKVCRVTAVMRPYLEALA